MSDQWTAYDTLAFSSWAEAHEGELLPSQTMGPPDLSGNPMKKYVVRCAELIHQRNAAQAEAEKWRAAAANWCEEAQRARKLLRIWVALSLVIFGTALIVQEMFR